ncbi:HMA2 domain-containing protein [Dissulfurispira sp.]|uniref:HMA2 domain-containing protein n=1 Tax=Dissulfurispira sp. TaxID=2817609 RepID=UPI002FDA31C8
MISYRIIHHIPGRIRIEVPAIKNLSISSLLQMSKQFSAIPIPEGIKDIRPNPFSGSIVITYIPEKIDIIEYLKDIASSIEMQKLMGGWD